jgi:hypothetical protein
MFRASGGVVGKPKKRKSESRSHAVSKAKRGIDEDDLDTEDEMYNPEPILGEVYSKAKVELVKLSSMPSGHLHLLQPSSFQSESKTTSSVEDRAIMAETIKSLAQNTKVAGSSIGSANIGLVGTATNTALSDVPATVTAASAPQAHIFSSAYTSSINSSSNTGDGAGSKD